MKTDHYQCPVCGFREMPYKPVPYNICPCCGTEFGVDDRYESYTQIRRSWIDQGMPWFDDITSPPSDWSPVLQLIQAGHGSDLINIGSAASQNQSENIYIDPQSWRLPNLRNTTGARLVTLYA